MVYACLLCNRKASKRDNIPLHRFAKDPVLRQRWKETCGLTEKDDVSWVYICSAHFSMDNHKKVDALQQPRIRLQIGAVPSISVPVTKFTPPALSPNMQNNATRSEKNYDSSLTEIAVNNDENIAHAASNELDTPRHEELVESPYISENASPPVSSELHTPQKRRFAEPRYASEISSPDFSTPKSTRRVLKLVKETDDKKSKAIKRLQDRVWRLKKRIGCLQDLVQHLTDKGFMTKEAGDNLMVTYNLN